MATSWVHPTHGRTLHPPEQHLRTLSKIRHVAAAPSLQTIRPNRALRSESLPIQTPVQRKALTPRPV